ncbi:Hypothetical protein FSTVST1_346 [Faustovirus ST1]|nr:Hypothetical protein FSTVST1_346 [Faustovirus ST1]
MRKHQRAVVLGFNGPNNREFLQAELAQLYSNDPRVTKLISNYIGDWMSNFTYRAESELGYVDSIPVDIGKYECGNSNGNCGARSGQFTARGVVSNPYRDRVERDLNALNREFIADRFEFIRTHFNLNLTKHTDSEMLYKKAGVVSNIGAGIGNYATFRVGDGAPTTRKMELYKNHTADDLLKEWYNNAGKSVYLRDDTQGDLGSTSLSVSNNNPDDCGYNRLDYTKHSNPELDYGIKNNYKLQKSLISNQPAPYPMYKTGSIPADTPTHSSPYNARPIAPYTGESMTQPGNNRSATHNYAGKPKTVRLGHKLTHGNTGEFETTTDIGATGVDFYDYENLGENPQYDMLLNSTDVIHLNDRTQPLYAGGFGRNNPAEDLRLAKRQIFRKNEAGVENGIPRYESRLYKRNLDRDISENLRGYERDFGGGTRGYDMTDLYKRVDQRRQIHTEYDSTFVQDENGKWIPKHYPRRGYL